LCSPFSFSFLLFFFLPFSKTTSELDGRVSEELADVGLTRAETLEQGK
jgi:hypothetical protein